MKTKIRHYITPQRLLAGLGLIFLIVLSLRVDVTYAQVFTQGYSSDEPLESGMVVRLLEEDTTKVAAVSQEAAQEAHGVVVNKNDAPATISAEGQEVFIATSGKYNLLVSDQNGPIKPGDYIVVSSISGIGMKVDDIQPVVVARALEAFDGSDNQVSTAKVGEASVSIGKIQADFSVSGNPLQRPPEQKLPDFLQRAAENIAQKPVSMARVYLSLAILLLSTAVSTVLMYGSVRSAITSIGRNPLSKKSIVRSMIQVVIVGTLIFIVGVFGVYLLLKL